MIFSTEEDDGRRGHPVHQVNLHTHRGRPVLGRAD